MNAGALKVGDKVSTRDSIPEASTLPSPRLAANDNQPLTVTDIVRDSRAARVYNFEVESLSGEITHNYFVGDDGAWVHNIGKIKGAIAAAFMEYFGDNPSSPGYQFNPEEPNRGGYENTDVGCQVNDGKKPPLKFPWFWIGKAK